MSVTLFQANKILNLCFGSVDYAKNTKLYLGLSTTPIARNGTGHTEPTDSAYKRLSFDNNKNTFTQATDGTLKNKVSLSFQESVGDWGTITHVFISDALTGGNILYYDPLDTPRIVQSASSLVFPVNSITISLNE